MTLNSSGKILRLIVLLFNINLRFPWIYQIHCTITMIYVKWIYMHDHNNRRNLNATRIWVLLSQHYPFGFKDSRDSLNIMPLGQYFVRIRYKTWITEQYTTYKYFKSQGVVKSKPRFIIPFHLPTLKSHQYALTHSMLSTINHHQAKSKIQSTNLPRIPSKRIMNPHTNTFPLRIILKGLNLLNTHYVI